MDPALAAPAFGWVHAGTLKALPVPEIWTVMLAACMPLLSEFNQPCRWLVRHLVMLKQRVVTTSASQWTDNKMHPGHAQFVNQS